MAHLAWMAHYNKTLWLLFLTVKARNLASFRGDGAQWGLYVSQLFMFPYGGRWTEKIVHGSQWPAAKLKKGGGGATEMLGPDRRAAKVGGVTTHPPGTGQSLQ